MARLHCLCLVSLQLCVGSGAVSEVKCTKKTNKQLNNENEKNSNGHAGWQISCHLANGVKSLRADLQLVASRMDRAQHISHLLLELTPNLVVLLADLSKVKVKHFNSCKKSYFHQNLLLITSACVPRLDAIESRCNQGGMCWLSGWLLGHQNIRKT